MAVFGMAGCEGWRHGCCHKQEPVPAAGCCPAPAPVIPAAPAPIPPAPGTAYYVQPPCCATPMP